MDSPAGRSARAEVDWRTENARSIIHATRRRLTNHPPRRTIRRPNRAFGPGPNSCHEIDTRLVSKKRGKRAAFRGSSFERTRVGFWRCRHENRRTKPGGKIDRWVLGVERRRGHRGDRLFGVENFPNPRRVLASDDPAARPNTIPLGRRSPPEWGRGFVSVACRSMGCYPPLRCFSASHLASRIFSCRPSTTARNSRRPLDVASPH